MSTPGFDSRSPQRASDQDKHHYAGCSTAWQCARFGTERSLVQIQPSRLVHPPPRDRWLGAGLNGFLARWVDSFDRSLIPEALDADERGSGRRVGGRHIWADGDNGNTLGLHPGDRGSIPRRSIARSPRVIDDADRDTKQQRSSSSSSTLEVTRLDQGPVSKTGSVSDVGGSSPSASALIRFSADAGAC
jgi:hypothetical protein